MTTELDQPLVTISVRQTARLTGTSHMTVWEAVRRGEIAAIRVGNRIRVLAAPLRERLQISDAEMRRALKDVPMA